MQIKFYCCNFFKTEQTRKHTISQRFLAMKANKKSDDQKHKLAQSARCPQPATAVM